MANYNPDTFKLVAEFRSNGSEWDDDYFLETLYQSKAEGSLWLNVDNAVLRGWRGTRQISKQKAKEWFADLLDRVCP